MSEFAPICQMLNFFNSPIMPLPLSDRLEVVDENLGKGKCGVLAIMKGYTGFGQM